MSLQELEKTFEFFSFTPDDERLDPDVDYSHDFFKVLSVDVGVQHLGLALALVNKDYTLDRIIDTNLIDITRFTHNVCTRDKCPLYHTKTFYDWLTHIFIEHPAFSEADVILIERQPPIGASFTVVEQIIFGRFRDKTWLINPKSVHCHFGIGYLDYEGRKRYSEKVALFNLSEKQKDDLEEYDRKHDIGDAICQLKYWCDKRNYEYRLKEQQKLSCLKNKDTFKYMESFNFVPKILIK